LDLSNLGLETLPAEIGTLPHLQSLQLCSNRLSNLPSEIANLSNLQYLYLCFNQFTSLPVEIGTLSNLCYLDLRNNHLQSLPSELGQLTSLHPNPCQGAGIGLLIDHNPLTSPPPEVIAQGTPAILDYLRNQAWWHFQRLILGGASGIGIVVATILGLRWRNNGGKRKKKNGQPITKN
jgi:internalin A